MHILYSIEIGWLTLFNFTIGDSDRIAEWNIKYIEQNSKQSTMKTPTIKLLPTPRPHH